MAYRITPIDDGVWVRAALLNRPMMLDRMPSDEELRSPRLSLARWPDLEAMIEDINWSIVAPATPAPVPPEWGASGRGQPRASAGRPYGHHEQFTQWNTSVMVRAGGAGSMGAPGGRD